MPQPRTHRIDVYDAWLHVAVTARQWRRLQADYDLADNDSVGAVHLFVDPEQHNQPHLAVWVDRSATSDQAKLVDLITHEATHAAAQLLDHVEQRADRHDSEALAYLAGYVAARVWESVA